MTEPTRKTNAKKKAAAKPAEEPAGRPSQIRVRATVNMQGLRCGYVALVDPSVPYIARCLDKGLLVPVEAV